MANLASPADVEDRLSRDLTGADFVRIEHLLRDASAAVRVYTGRDFGTGEQTSRFRARDGQVTLPRRPVTAVTAVTDVNGDDVSFVWDGIDLVRVWPLVAMDGFERGMARSRFEPVVDITYTGGAAVPPAIRAVVCQMAARAFGAAADSTGIQSETIAGYSYSVGAAAAAGGVGMMLDERQVLDRYRRVGGVAWVGAR